MRFIWLAWERATRIAEDENLLAKTLLDLTLEVTSNTYIVPCKPSKAFSSTKRAYEPDDFRLGIHQAKRFSHRKRQVEHKAIHTSKESEWNCGRDHYYPSTILRQLQLAGR